MAHDEEEIRTWHFGRTADGERVPLVLGDRRNLHVHIVARLMVEVVRLFDHQVRYLEKENALIVKRAHVAKTIINTDKLSFKLRNILSVNTVNTVNTVKQKQQQNC